MVVVTSSFSNGSPNLRPGFFTHISGSVGAWETATLTGSWTANVSYVCQRRRVGDTVVARARIAATSASAPTPAVNLSLNPFSDLTVDTSKANIAVPGGFPIGYGRVWNNNVPPDGELWQAELILIYSAGTFLVAWQSNTAGGTTANHTIVTPSSPFGWNTSDSCFVEYSYPVLEWA